MNHIEAQGEIPEEAEIWAWATTGCLTLQFPFWIYLMTWGSPQEPNRREDTKTRLKMYITAGPTALFVTGIITTAKMMEHYLGTHIEKQVIIIISSSTALLMGIVSLLAVALNIGTQPARRRLSIAFAWAATACFILGLSYFTNTTSESLPEGNLATCLKAQEHWGYGQKLQVWSLIYALVPAYHYFIKRMSQVNVAFTLVDLLIVTRLQTKFFIDSLDLVYSRELNQCSHYTAAMVSVQVAGWLALPRVTVCIYWLVKIGSAVCQVAHFYAMRFYFRLCLLLIDRRELSSQRYGRVSKLHQMQLQVTTRPGRPFYKEELPVDLLENDVCPICMEAYEQGNKAEKLCYTKRCLHIFHYECLKKWAEVSDKCPICKQLM